MAAIANLLVDQGATFTSTVTVFNTDDTLFTLTDYTVAAQLRKSYSSSTSTTFTASIDSDPTTGKIILELTPTQTAALEEGRYVYDVEVTNTLTSEVTRVIQGVVTVSPNVTRA